MDKFSKLSLLVLCGIPLPDLNIDLDRLPSPGDVLSVVRSAFSAFLSEDCVVESIDRLEPVDAPGSDLHLIYVYGHAWLDHDSPRVLIGSGQPTEAVDGFELMTVALSRTSPERTVLILDCCHAAAFDSLIRSPLPVPRLVVYGSGAAESAIALRGDNASRLSLALHRGLEGPRRLVDLTGVVIEVAHQLSSDGVIAGQDVSYRMSGAAVMLTRGTSPAIRRRERTVSIVRNALLASGALIAAILGLAGWFYWTHVLLDMSVGNLGSIASSEITLTVFQEDPNSNRSDVDTSNVIQGDQIRVWIPAAMSSFGSEQLIATTRSAGSHFLSFSSRASLLEDAQPGIALHRADSAASQYGLRAIDGLDTRKGIGAQNPGNTILDRFASAHRRPIHSASAISDASRSTQAREFVSADLNAAKREY